MNELDQAFWRLCDWLELNQNLLLKNASAFSVIFPLYFCLRYYAYVRNGYLPVILYFIAAFITEVYGLSHQFDPKGNLNAYNIFSLVELYLLGILYANYTYLPLFRKFILYSCIVFQPFGIYSFITVGPYQYNVFLFAGGAILISIYLVLYVIDAIITRKQGINYFMLWFTMGAIIFFPNTQLIYLKGEFLILRHISTQDLWNATLYLNISFHCIASASFLSLLYREA